MSSSHSDRSRQLFLAQRVDAFRDVLQDKKLDGYLLTHLSDLFYFTDYKSEGYYGLISSGGAWLFLPNLLFDQGKASTFGFECLNGRFYPALKQVLKNSKLKKVAFDLIIAGGPNSAFPHHLTSDYRLRNGEPVICDIGATVQGYRSDLTRTFPLGKISPTFSRVFRIVEKAQKEGIRRLRPGVTAG